MRPIFEDYTVIHAGIHFFYEEVYVVVVVK